MPEPADTTSPPAVRSADAVSVGRDAAALHDPFGFEALDLQALRRRRGVKWSRSGPGVLPAWVADMDFDVPPVVRAALDDLLDRGDLGYPDWDAGAPLATAFAQRMRRRHGWDPDPAHVRMFTDINQALQVLLHVTTRPGDAIALHVPTYPPFLEAIAHLDQRMVASPITRDAHGWHFDPQRLAHDVAAQGCRTLLLVNPHNPTGRVFTRAELDALARIVVDHDLLVIADEVHAELVHDGRAHIPFASLGPEVARRTVTTSSATKAFNLAGIRCAVAHIGPPHVRAALAALPPNLFGEIGVPGVTATLAAWAHGDAWLAAVRAHLVRMRDLLVDLLTAHLPTVGYDPPEGTYLAWLDCRRLGLPEEPAAFFRTDAGVELSPGHTFGAGGRGFARLNFATSSGMLTEIVTRMGAAVRRA